MRHPNVSMSISSLLAALLASGFGSAHATDAATCLSGFVWREAFPGDLVCVEPTVRNQAAIDNRAALSRVQPGGGASGPHTCIPGFVWRAAKPDDLVCVTPRVRDQAAADNAAARTRTASTATRPVPPPNAAAPAGSYRFGDWSAWKSEDHVDYRYKWGWNSADNRYLKNLDAVVQVRNRTQEPWRGHVGASCPGGASRQVDVRLAVNESRELKFNAPNCGTLAQPWFNPGVSQSFSL